jgi:rhodanese-related sulfurtransferase
MQKNKSRVNDADVPASTNPACFEDLVRSLQPINRLPPHIVTKVIAQSTIECFASEEDITEQVRSSLYAHYLAHGALTLVASDGKTEHLASDTPKALKAIERRYGAYKNCATVGPCALIRVPWDLLEGFLLEFAPADLSTQSEVEVAEIFSATISEWMVRILQSELFSLLPATNIQEILAQMVLTPAGANQVIVEEGNTGGHFYIVESGQYVVTKKAAATGREIKLATLGPGDSFGEAALITDTPRSATVTASQSGNLLKLDGGHFRRWMMDPAINRVSADEAKSLSDNGYQWIDVREPAAYAEGSIPISLNIGINVLRLNVNRLAADKKYIVCDSDPKTAALATFILGERGFNARGLDVPIKEYCGKFTAELEINEQLDPSRSPPVATEKNETLTSEQSNEAAQASPANLDKTLPELASWVGSEPAVEPGLEVHQPQPQGETTRKPDLSETVLGIGLTGLIGEIAGTGDDSGAGDSAELAESETTDIPANFNAVQEYLSPKPPTQSVDADEQLKLRDVSGEAVALENREDKPQQKGAHSLRDDLSTTNVVELVVAKDPSDVSNRLRTSECDQLGVFQQPSLTDSLQQPCAVNTDAQLSTDMGRLSSEMGAKVAELVGKHLEMQRSELDSEYEKRISAVREEATNSMREHELKVAASYTAIQQRIKDDGKNCSCLRRN